ncbi:glycosyltransferase [Pseudomonas nitroreducens]|uniref:glycosyltransferase n=1 Tax=Pseudomonas nitroreducens TaxID=46680 RepID=UPI0028A894AE|nr:glycosyltransferase [Pseudomonas nitroreducens]
MNKTEIPTFADQAPSLMEDSQLQDENAKLKLKIEYLEQQARAHEQQLSDFQRLQHDHYSVLTSTTWRMTAFARKLIISLKRIRHRMSAIRQISKVFRAHVKRDGFSPTARKALRALSTQGFGVLWRSVPYRGASNGRRNFALAEPTRSAAEMFPNEVLLISEVSIPQCLKYRVVQKMHMIRSLGYNCRYLDWRDHHACLNALQTCSMVIFYRVPAFPDVLLLIEEAKRLKALSFWEVDDLIFDPEKYRKNSNLNSLNEETIRSLMDGVTLYRQAMLACDRAIASTPGLAAAMRDAGVNEVSVIENALDTETLVAADAINASMINTVRDEQIRIVYGSGTKTHDADFLEAAQAIYATMEKRANLRLRIIGDLTLPSYFDNLNARIERLPFADYSGYLKSLAECDISIAPLEDSTFNDAKSNIKFLEASSVLLPSVCSPRSAFRQAIAHGFNGFLANDPQSWEESLLALVDDAQLRQKISRNAHQTILDYYSPDKIAASQVRQVLPTRPAKKTKRILSANIFFAPRSFGGATVVAEQMSRILAENSALEQFVFTSLPPETAAPYNLARYEAHGVSVLGMGLPDILSPTADFENKDSVPIFEKVLQSVSPDLVHLHSIQGLGALLADCCRRAGIPFIVTLHDAWWICGRQFMINNHGQYCGQTQIDLEVCTRCVSNPSQNNYRQRMLGITLQTATSLLVPSQFTKNLYVANGFSEEKIHVNKNGVLAPAAGFRKKPSNTIRFGYVGGNTPIKGIHLITQALSAIDRNDYELVIVDNLLNLGSHSFNEHSVKVPGRVRIIPGYNQSNMDEFFSDIDVLLFPTQWKETFGLTIREALVRDVWVISTDAGGTVEDIVDGTNGTIIPLTSDEQYLKDAIVSILDDQERFLNHSNPFKNDITLFSRQALELQGFYEKIIGDERK